MYGRCELQSRETIMASMKIEESKQHTEERPAASELHDAEAPILHCTETNDSPSRAPTDEPRLTESWRQVVGIAMDSVSDVINDNIVAARYATFASVALLSAYGLANTPLFFRFKTVSEIPASYFLRRRTIHGRLIRVVDNVASAKGDAEKPIVCMVRHLSPIGRLLTRSAFDFLMRTNPAAAAGKNLEDNTTELLKVEIAGLREPPCYTAPGHAEQPGEWLRRLADQRAPVSCQLVSRRARIERAPKRDTSALAEFRKPIGQEQTAVCRLKYRPDRQLFRSDLAESLVRYGRASIASGMNCSMDNWTIVDSSDHVEDLKKNIKYLNQLDKAEYKAATESEGMWDDPFVRASRQDLVEEVTFQNEANMFQKIWRWLRG